MSRRSLIPLVVLLALALFGGLWFALGERRAIPEAAAPGPPSAEPAGGVTDPLQATDSPAKSAAPPIADREAGAHPERQEAAPDLFAEALWIEGLLVLPEDLPADELVRMESEGLHFGKRSSGPRTFTTDLEPDGRFRLAFAPRTPSGTVSLQARYLYLERRVQIRPQERSGDLVLTPQAGGRIVGRVVLPGSTRKERAFETTTVTAGVYVGPGWVSRKTAVAADGSFELTGVPFGSPCTMTLCSGELADLVQSDVLVERFATSEVDLAPLPGSRLEGIVVDEEDDPLAGVRIRLTTKESDDHPEFPGRVSLADSNADGTFEFRGLAPLDAHLRVCTDGFEPLSLELGRLPEGGLLEGVRIELSRGWSVRGVVVWLEGTPVAGARVRAWERSSREKFRGRHQRVDSGADGSFLIEGFSADAVRIRASAEREVTWPGGGGEQEWTVEQVFDSSHALDLRLTLTGGDVLRGRVVDTAGRPLRSFRVIAERDARASGNGIDERVTESFRSGEGTFELTGLNPGVWHLSAEAREHALRAPVQVQIPTLGTVEIVMLPGATVSGVVRTPAGDPVSGARVQAGGQPDSGLELDWERGRTNGEGRFEVDGIRARSIRVHAEAEGWSASETIELELHPGERRDGLVLTLKECGRVAGEVSPELERRSGRTVEITGEGLEATVQTDAAGCFALDDLIAGSYRAKLHRLPGEELGPGGNEVGFAILAGETTQVVVGASPPQAARIRVYGLVTRGGTPVANCWVDIGYGNKSVITDAEGHYEVVVTESGRMSLRLCPPGGEWIRLRREIGPGPDQLLDFVLPDASLSGTVLDSEGRPAVGAKVRVRTTAPGSPEENWGQSETTANAKGRFHFENLGAGSCRLSVWNGFRGETLPHANFTSDEWELRDGEHLEGVVLQLRLAAEIEGTVTRADGTPVRAARIDVLDLEGKPIFRNAARTDRYGHFIAQRVPPRMVDVVARRGAGVTGPLRVVLSAGERAVVDPRFP